LICHLCVQLLSYLHFSDDINTSIAMGVDSFVGFGPLSNASIITNVQIILVMKRIKPTTNNMATTAKITGKEDYGQTVKSLKDFVHFLSKKRKR
jgi:hypothetical protein